MRLALKLSLLLAAASAGPVVATLVTLPSHRDELLRNLDGFYLRKVKVLAEEVDRELGAKLDALALPSRAVQFAALSEEEQHAALDLIYKQTPHLDIVGLFDARGQSIVEPVFYERPAELGLENHEAVTEADLAEYARHVPLDGALSDVGRAIGPVYVVPDAGQQPIPRVVLAVAVRGPGAERWVLAVELSLRSVAERFAQASAHERGEAFLVDQEGKVIAHPDPKLVAARADLSKAQPISKEGDGAWLGDSATVDRVGWTAAFRQTEDVALAPIRRQMRDALLYAFIGLVGAFALGFTTVRAVTRPVGRLRAAAASVAQGALDTTVRIRGKDELAELGAAFNEMTRGLRERERLKKSFSRYVSGEIATRILKETSDLDLQGEQVEVTVVFLDVRGFTTLAEEHTPREVVDLLNAYFEQIVRVVMGYEGVINKFIGDAVMAVFGVPRAIPEPELRAVTAALEIQATVSAMNERRRRSGLAVADFGIGVNTGSAIAGNLGGAERMEYTVIGDAVNLAQRLQGQAQGGEVVVSAATFERLKGRARVEPRGEVKVKGKERPVEIFRVLGLAGREPEVEGRSVS